jgi:hypothetical protein
MHVGREPHRIANAGILNEREQVRNLQLAAARGPIVALGDGLDAPLPLEIIGHQQADGLVCRNHLPGGA